MGIRMSDKGRALCFCVLLAILSVPAVLFCLTFDPRSTEAATELPTWVARPLIDAGTSIPAALVEIFPQIKADANLFIEFTPAGLAVALAFLAPKKEQAIAFTVSIALCIFGYFAYLAFQRVLYNEQALDSLADAMFETVVTKDGATERISEAEWKSRLEIFGTTSRTFFAIVVAGLLGVRLREKVTGQ